MGSHEVSTTADQLAAGAERAAQALAHWRSGDLETAQRHLRQAIGALAAARDRLADRALEEHA